MEDTIKLAVIGLSNAGKTSILKRCFEEHELNEIEKITPTIMVAQIIYNLDPISKRISVWDFGGQKKFRDVYLQNQEYFKKTKILLFVVDVLGSKNFAEEKEYFGSVLKIFEALKRSNDIEPPHMYVFIHKCDPDQKEKMNEKIARCLMKMTELFGTDVTFFMTSIYDASACRSLNNILFFSLPEEVIIQVFSKEVLDDLRQVISAKIKDKHSIEISEVSKIFGDMTGRKLHDLWMNTSIKKPDKGKKSVKITKELQIFLENGQKKFKLRCPYSKKEKNCPYEDCIIVQGFIAGILTSMNLSQRSLKINRVKDEVNCYFIF